MSAMCLHVLALILHPALFPKRSLVDPLFGLSFGKETDVEVQISHLCDRSPPLVKIVFHIQMAEDKMMMQSTNLFRVTLQSP